MGTTMTKDWQEAKYVYCVQGFVRRVDEVEWLIIPTLFSKERKKDVARRFKTQEAAEVYLRREGFKKHHCWWHKF